MKLLLDTHILIWASKNNPKLSKSAKNLILNEDNDIYFSTAAIWELIIKKNTGKFDIDIKSFVDALYNMNFFELPIEMEHIFKLEELENYHKDPFDRIMIAQALAEPIKLLTHNKILLQYSPDLIEYV